MVILFLYEDIVVKYSNAESVEPINIYLSQIGSGWRKFLKVLAQSLVDLQENQKQTEYEFISHTNKYGNNKNIAED